jgi:hypothetical protein
MPLFSELNQFWRDRCIDAGFQFLDVTLPEDDRVFPDITVDLLAMVETLRNRNRPVIVRTLGMVGGNLQIYWSVDGNAPGAGAGC